MVTLRVIVEGGVAPTNVDAATANNVEALREALHRFFARLLGRDDVDLIVDMGRGCRSVAKRLASDPQAAFLYVDSDAPYERRTEWFDRLANPVRPENSIVLPAAARERVFFMVQEMEAWFLKQPACLERWAAAEGYERQHPEEMLAGHSLLRGGDVENIAKPSEKLEILMRHFFPKKGKKKIYGKLRTAPGLLDALDAAALRDVDRELQRFAACATCQ